MHEDLIHVDDGTGAALCAPGQPLARTTPRVERGHTGPITCPTCRQMNGAAIHLTTDQGYTIACRRDQPRTTIEPIPVIVELADNELITCPDCTAIAIERAKLQPHPSPPPPELAPASLERIASALERIANVLEDPRSQVEMVVAVVDHLTHLRGGR